MNLEIKKKLIQKAKEVRENAYAPYSKYKVGCAVLTDDNQIFTGCNVENASFRLTNCAEVTALTKAVSEGYKKFKLIAIVTKDGGSPCGACRQVIWELCGKINILISDINENITQYSSDELLPKAFEF